MMQAIKPYRVEVLSLALILMGAFAFGFKPSDLFNLSLLILSIITIIRLCINIVKTVKESSIRYSINAIINGISLALVIPVIWLGVYEKNNIFREEIDSYNNVVAYLERTDLAQAHPLHRINLPNQYQGLAKVVLGQKNENGTVTVEFLIGGGFPVRHVGYLYRSDNNLEADSFYTKRWPINYRILPNWYAISD